MIGLVYGPFILYNTLLCNYSPICVALEKEILSLPQKNNEFFSQ